MANPLLYVHPTCSKARAAQDLLDAAGFTYDAVNYLERPLSAVELHRVVAALGGEPAALVRRDGCFAELGLHPAQLIDADAVVAVLLDHPELMERPVFMVGEMAVIGRPPERVLELT